jgi:hypothetical protein
MNNLLITAAASNENTDESTTTIRGMMRKHAIELAMNDGRSPLEACRADWQQAKQELGDPDMTMIS